MICFRLSEGEYKLLKAQYRTYGARTISDLARLALQRVTQAAPDSHDTIAVKLEEVNQRVHAIEAQLCASWKDQLRRSDS